jgi:hypothetical protein
MTPVLIVPGLGGSGPDHWQTHLERSLRVADRVRQDDWDRPDLIRWIECLAQAVEKRRRVILVASTRSAAPVPKTFPSSWCPARPTATIARPSTWCTIRLRPTTSLISWRSSNVVGRGRCPHREDLSPHFGGRTDPPVQGPDGKSAQAMEALLRGLFGRLAAFKILIARLGKGVSLEPRPLNPKIAELAAQLFDLP